MRAHWTASWAVAGVLGLLFVAGAPGRARLAAQALTDTAGPSQQPFALELWGFRFTEPEISLDAPPPDRLVFRLAAATRPVALSALKTTINGDPAAIACEVRRQATQLAVTCDLRRYPGLALRLGRNELRVAVDGTANEASYVVFLEGGTSSSAAAPLVAKERRRSSDATDSEPPVLHVTRPAGLDAAPGDGRTVSVAGQVSDNRGVLGVTIDGRPATLRRPPREQRRDAGAVAFDEAVQVPSDMSQVAVEARDQAGNLTRVLFRSNLARPALAEKAPGRRAALVVGVSEYRSPRDGLGNLRFAASDARAVYELLVDPAFGGFATQDVEMLLDHQATVPAVRDALARLAGRLGPEDLLFVYVNAHGAPDPYEKAASPPFYFLLHDTRLSDLPRTGYRMDTIAEVLNQSRFRAGRKIIFIDACHSGGVSSDLVEAASRGLDQAARSLARQQGVALLTSSSVDETSLELVRGRSGNGVFTLALLEALRGAADENRDNLITAGELFSAVSTCVRRATAGRQNPQALYDGADGLLMARVPGGAAPGPPQGGCSP